MSLERQIINSSKYSKILLAICLIAGDEPDKGKQLENYVLFKQKQQQSQRPSTVRGNREQQQQQPWLGSPRVTPVPATT